MLEFVDIMEMKVLCVDREAIASCPINIISVAIIFFINIFESVLLQDFRGERDGVKIIAPDPSRKPRVSHRLATSATLKPFLTESILGINLRYADDFSFRDADSTS